MLSSNKVTNFNHIENQNFSFQPSVTHNMEKKYNDNPTQNNDDPKSSLYMDLLSEVI